MNPKLPPRCSCSLQCDLHLHGLALLELVEAFVREHEQLAHDPKQCPLCEVASLLLRKVGAR